MSADDALRVVQIAVLAKAPVAGQVKTRLIPALGDAACARLHRRLVLRTLRCALDARLGPVTLWCAPDARHRFFRALQRVMPLDLRVQTDADLGRRMHDALSHHVGRGPALLIGTDCAVLEPDHLRRAARALVDGADAVFVPVDDGGYVGVGLRRAQPALFDGMTWSTDRVMAQTRARACALGLAVHELDPLWDIDRPADLDRLAALDHGALLAAWPGRRRSSAR